MQCDSDKDHSKRYGLSVLQGVLVAGLALSGGVEAAGGVADETLNPVVVLGSRIEQSLADVLTSVTVINRKDIERAQAATLADLLQGEAGFEFGRNGGPGAVTSFFLRGQNSISMAVYVDGVKSQVDSIGTVKAVDLPLGQIEKIEILRGNAGALYGEAAIGGVISITTRQGVGAPKAYASMTVGSHNTSNVSVGYGGEVEQYRFKIATSQYRTTGVSAVNTTQQPYANPDNDGTTNQALIASLIRKVNSRLELGARVNVVRNRFSYDDLYATSAAETTDTHVFKTSSDDLSLFGNYQWTDQWKTSLDVTQSTLQYKDYKNGVQLSTDNGGYSEGNQVASRWFNRYQLGSGLLNFGTETVRADYTSYGDTVKRESDGYFVGYNDRFQQFDVQVNARHDDILATGSGSNKRSRADTGLLGIGYYLTEGLKLTSAISTAFRAPAAGELFGYGGNTSLNPETHRSTEAGLVYSHPKALLRLVRFETKTDNAIVYTNASSTYANVPKVQNQGYELTASAHWEQYSVRFSAVSQDPRDVQTNLQLSRRAKQYGSIDVSRQWDAGYEVGTKVYASSRRVDGTENLSSYTVFNLYGSKKIDSDWTARLKIQNAFNADYQLAYGYNTPKAEIFLSLIYQPK